MAADIRLKKSSVSGKKPDASNIAVGEPVVNLADRVIYTKDGNGDVVVIGANLTVQLVNTSNAATVSVADVRTLQFDDNSGFDIIDRANGIAKVQMNSTFKTWNVYGQANLVADGLDTVNIVAGDYITITTNPAADPQQIRFSLSNTLSTSNVAEGANLYFTDARVSSAISNQTLNNATFSGELVTNSILKSLQSSGDEGGELILANAITNSTISGPVAIDIYQNKLRIFETTGTNRGVYIDITAANTGVGTNLLTGGGGGSGTITNVAGVDSGAVSNVQLTAGVRQSGIFTTANVIESSNLYYTDGRVYANVVAAGFYNTVSNTTPIGATEAGTTLTITHLNSGVTPTTYGSATQVPVYIVDATGHITSASNVAIAIPSSALTTDVALGTQTSGAYVSNLVAGTGVTLTGLGNEGTTPTISIGQDVGTNNNVTFANLTVTGNLTVQGNAVTFESNTLVIIDPLIQVGKNPVGDAVDLGFFGHYIGGSPSTERHAGLFRDATDGQFKLFTNLDPEPSTIVDTANASYQSANLVVNFVVGKVSDISNHTTASLAENSANLYYTNARAYANVVAAGFYDTVSNTAPIGATENGTTLSISHLDSGVATGTYGNATIVPVITVNSTGHVTSVSNVTISATGGSGGGATTFSSSPPVSPNDGDIWIDSDTGSYYIYINDGDSSQWVEYNTSGAAGGGSSNSTLALASSGTGSGFITIEAPNTNSSVSVSLADVSGTLSPLARGTVQAASSTSVDFTGIPSWVKRITVILSTVSTSGASFPLFQLGTGGTAQTSGYSSLSAAVTSSAQGVSTSAAGFILRNSASSADVMTGQLTLINITGNDWVGSGVFMDTQDNRQVWLSGTVTLSGVLDMVRLTTVNGTDTFDADNVNILYE